MPAATTRYDAIDDCLGPARTRFFGEGYKRIDNRVVDIAVAQRPDGRARVSAKALVSYPADWSKKSAAMDLRPHLSSVDTLLIGARLSEVCVLHGRHLDAENRRAMWLRGFAIRAGSTPQEELGGFGVGAEEIGSREAPGAPDWLVSVVECAVGSMKIRCEVEHPAGPRAAPGGDGPSAYYPSEDDVLGPRDARYYGSGYKERSQTIRDLEIEPGGDRVHARVAVSSPTGTPATDHGLGARYQPSLSMVDCMTAAAQAAQVLLYHQDGIDRRRTNTLWMRRVRMETATPLHPLDEPFPVTVHASDTETVEFAGGTWRTSTMTSDFQGIRARASLAHRLPDGFRAGGKDSR